MQGERIKIINAKQAKLYNNFKTPSANYYEPMLQYGLTKCVK